MIIVENGEKLDGSATESFPPPHVCKNLPKKRSLHLQNSLKALRSIFLGGGLFLGM